MNLIQPNYPYFANLLQDGGVIMICSALQMQKDVEKVLNDICIAHNGTTLQYYIDNKQLLTDCY